MLNGDSVELTRYIYRGLVSQFKPFVFDSPIEVQRAFDIDFYREEFIVYFELYRDHYYRVSIGIDSIENWVDPIFLGFEIGTMAGKYFRSIELPVGDNVVLGEN